jgi:hypothetical protein
LEGDGEEVKRGVGVVGEERRGEERREGRVLWGEGRRRERMACRVGSRLPFLIVSHEAVVVRAEEWLTTKKDSKHGDNFGDKRAGGRGGEKGESSSSVVGAHVRGASSPTAAAKLLDVEMLSEETSQPLSPSFKLDG